LFCSIIVHIGLNDQNKLLDSRTCLVHSGMKKSSDIKRRCERVSREAR